MKASDEKLRASLMEAMKLDEAKLEKELQGMEPHVFSESFEKRMDKLFASQKRKLACRRILRHAATAAAVLILVCGSVFISSEKLTASVLSVDIQEWLDRYFTVEDGVDKRKDNAIVFEESQLGYIPEGFEKVLEDKSFLQVYYKFENSNGDYFWIKVLRDETTLHVDNENVQTIVDLNEAGFEYTLISREEQDTQTIVWKDDKGIYYYLRSVIKSEELLKIMNNIKY